MKPRLYLEMTIPSYLAARRSRDLRLAADQETTHEWWAQRRHSFDLYVSDLVLREARRGDAQYAASRLDKLSGIAILSPAPAAEQLAERLLRDGIIPAIAADDTTHLGLAAAHGLDFLLTWNCRHINNRALERRIEHACLACGLACPVICPPAELMEE